MGRIGSWGVMLRDEVGAMVRLSLLSCLVALGRDRGCLKNHQIFAFQALAAQPAD